MNKNVNEFKAVLTAVFASMSALFGNLTIPILLMVLCNVVDYITGLMACTARQEHLSSYKSIRGIFKKVNMWLLVVVGAILDELLSYSVTAIGLEMPFSFLIACIVAIWIVLSELLSILENIKDMGVNMPAFLIPLITKVKSQVEDKVKDTEDDTENDTKDDTEGE